MDALEYAERTAGETLNQVREGYDSQHERAYKVATLVASGAGAAGVYALGKIGTPGAQAAMWWPLAALSCWWFTIVGVTLVRGAASKKLMAGTASAAIRARMAKNLEGRGELTAESAEAALWSTRWEQLASVDMQIEEYSAAASQRARVLDCAYWALVGSPAIAIAAYVVATWLTTR